MRKINWKRQLRNLAKDFFVQESIVEEIIKNVEENCTPPSWWRSSAEIYLYEKAHHKLMQHI